MRKAYDVGVWDWDWDRDGLETPEIERGVAGLWQFTDEFESADGSVHADDHVGSSSGSGSDSLGCAIGGCLTLAAFTFLGFMILFLVFG